MNFHQRSFSEQPQPLRPQQSPLFANNNNNSNGSAMDTMEMTSSNEPTSTTRGGEILHSDSQQSLDRLFNPTSMPSYTPLRDRNLPASFFNPPWKSATPKRDNMDDDGDVEEKRDNPVASLHMRSVSFDQRTKALPQVRRGHNLHMRTQSTLAPMTSLMGQASAITESSPSVISAASSNGHLNADFGSSEFISSPPTNGLHRSTDFGAHITNQSHPQQQQQHQQHQHHHHHHHSHSLSLNQNQFVHQNDQQGQPLQPFAANRATIVHNHHNIHQQPVTSYNHDGHFVDNQYHQQSINNNNTITNHHGQHHEPKFHVAHSTYVTPMSVVQNNHLQQQLPSSATVVAPPFSATNQLCPATDGFSSSGSTMSHSCSNSDFHSGSCSSLHSRSQSCQSSVLDSSMSNLGISGSSSDLTRDTTVAPMFDYAASTTPGAQQQSQVPSGGSYNQLPAQQQPMFSAQTTINYHHQHFQNPLTGLHQQQAPMEERRCGY